MNLGDFRLGDTFDCGFTTISSAGAPITLAGSPVVAAYPGNSTTEITAGITLTVDFDARTGLHNVRVVASSGNGYATATNYKLVLTAGTVDGTSVVGYVVAHFSIENRSALMPTTAARTLDVSAAGEAGLDWANIGGPTTSQTLSGTTVGTATALGANAVSATAIAADAITAAKIAAGAIDSATFANDTGLTNVRSATAQAGAATTITLDASASAVDDFYNGTLLRIVSGTGAGQARFITDYVGATKVATVNTWATNPDSTSVFVILPSEAASTGSVADAVLDDALIDSVPADGSLPTVRQAIYMIAQFLMERSVSGTTLTVRKSDGSTSLMTFTLSDATSPTSITRTT